MCQSSTQHSSGDLDTTFAGNGRATITFGGSWNQVAGVAIQPDGKLVVAGLTQQFSDADIALARYNPDARPDASFGTGGKVQTDLGTSDDEANALRIQADGTILVAGYSGGSADPSNVVLHYHPDGSLDTSFGSGGYTRTPYPTGFTSGGRDWGGRLWFPKSWRTPGIR